MKTLLVLVLSGLVLLGSSFNVLAGQNFPSLVGVWDVQTEGAFMLHGGAPGKYTHWSKNQTKLTGVAEILTQEGRVISGIFKTAKVSEPFIAVIGYDGNFHMADQDGFLDGHLVNKNRMETLYRHASARDSVVSAGVWTRRK